jgi:hypothetical protein
MPSPDRVVLELDSGAPITGRVCVDRHPPRPFSGWTDLFGVLRELAAPAGADGSAPPPPRKED